MADKSNKPTTQPIMIESIHREKTSDLLRTYREKTDPLFPFSGGSYGSRVYVVHNPCANIYKIGITSDFWARMKALECGCGMPLQPIIVLTLDEMDEPAAYIEAYLHKYYNNKRRRGEWFDLCQEDIDDIIDLLWNIEGACINELKNGEFVM